MITDKGRELLSKFMLGQAPSYATHISFGCGARPGTQTSNRNTMEFEMFRTPISSKGFVQEGGVTKIALAAELPTEEKFDITEVGIWSAGSNARAVNSDSRLLFGFGDGESWKLHDSSSVSNIPDHFTPLDNNDGTKNITVSDKIFVTNADNNAFQVSSRTDRFEGTRYLNRTILLAGDSSTIDASYNTTGSHIHLEGKPVNLVENTPNDEIKIALCVFSKESANSAAPAETKIVVEFLASELDPTTGYARLTHTISSADLASSRYIVITKKLSELEYSSQFSWANVQVTRLWASTTLGDKYFVAFDAIRFENVSQPNPLYALTGYSVVQNKSKPINKLANTSNYVEFRFDVAAL